ncbi:MAG: uroporphyrinogen-III synthase [Thermomicrobiales bacterium]
MADLQGRTVAFLEARRALELAGLIARHGGVPLAAPCLSERHDPAAPALVPAVAHLCDPAVTTAIFLTGVGTTTLFDAARLQGRADELRAALAAKRIAARGPKPTLALRKAGVRVDLTSPPPHTSEALLAALADWNFQGQAVAVQLYGGPPPALCAELARRGARVLTLEPYQVGRPDDEGPVLALLAALLAGQVDALAATSGAQIDNFFAIARDHGQEPAIRQALARIPVAAQGPATAAAWSRAGIPVAIQPEQGHMGGLVLAIARHPASRADGQTGSRAVTWMSTASTDGRGADLNSLPDYPSARLPD